MNGDSQSVINGVTLSTETGAAATAGTHPITATGGTAANYTIADFNGTLTVSQASLTVMADDDSKVYGAADPPLTFTPSGTLYYGDSYAVITGVTLSITTGAAAMAGPHAITASSGTAANYAISDVNDRLTVSQAPLTLMADDQSMNHYDSLPALTYRYTGFVLSENATSAGITGTVNVATTGSSTSSAGYYPIHPTATNFSAANYTRAGTQDGTLTVKPKVTDVRVHYGSKTMSLIGLSRDLPFVNITALDVLFSDDVVVTGSMLNLLGVKVPSYSASHFSYDGTKFDATWTLPSALGIDRLTLALSGVAALPTVGAGPNIAASSFTTKFAVLPGNVDGDGVVSAADGVATRNAIGTIDSAWFDVNGDGVVDLKDFSEVQRRIRARLP